MLKKISVGILVLLTAAFAGCGGSGGDSGDGSAGIALQSAVALSGSLNEPTSDAGVTPYIIPGENQGGNRTCAEVGAAFFGDVNYFEFSSDRSNYVDGAFGPALPAGISVVTDGTYVDWASTFGVGAVIVKGSNDANVYVYYPQAKSDSGLAAPPNASGGPAGLSNITFCWNPEENGRCYKYETAWSAGSRYNQRGNWATYSPYAAGSSKDLYAGQNMLAGTVTFSAVMDGKVTITITLNEGWVFDARDAKKDNVHIQGYSAAPAGNPAPGQFADKKMAEENPFVISVPAANFYGVHVAVGKEVECSE